MFIDPDGQPMTLFEWAELFENLEKRIMAQDDFADGYALRTIWIGHDVAVFATALFRRGRYVKELDRYPTKEIALAGHRVLLNRLRDAHSGPQADA